MSAARSLTPNFLTIAAALVALAGCQAHVKEGSPEEAYVDAGGAWAYGSVQLANMEAPGAIVLKRNAADQSLDTPEYQLSGAIQAVAGGASGQRDVAYVDWHPANNRLLAYAWTLDYAPLPGYPGVIRVSANVRRPSRSYYNQYKVYLGDAYFQNGMDTATVNLGQGVKLSLIADGVFSGQWALHYADAPKVIIRPWQGLCPKGVFQMPGQNPSQNPGQFDQCRPLPAQHDLCGGDPTKEGCRPRPPVQQPVNGGLPIPAPGVFDMADLEIISKDDRVFAMPAEMKEAKMIFVSETIKVASDEENAQLCAKRFYAVGRTLGRQVNTACVLKPAPAPARDGKLACGITVAFDQAQTYLERVCDVTAVFRDTQGAIQAETQTVQILKR